MINQLKEMFGLGPKVDYKQLTKEGAIPILVDREGNKSASGVEEIGDLTELPDLVKKL